jgi:hypothetical protein
MTVMNSLKFENTFNDKNGNAGDLFQTFVYELLRKSDYPRLHKFQTAGNDGGIDLIQRFNNERVVVECKFVGNKDIRQAISRWRQVRKHFEEHLSHPVPKRKLIKPWLNPDTPITSYLFCVSSEISNQNGFDEFEKEIADFFKSLAARYSHLAHLENIRVEIIDRSKLLQKLDNFPQLKFKWFSVDEKFGFIPIQNKPQVASFRSFLEEDSLPFYNRSRHLQKVPNDNIQSEEQLLEMLEDTSLHGLIITGNGGSGKTRLTLELGRLAKKKDWLVFRCNSTVNSEKLTKLGETIADDTKVLLLMDYVEIQKHFADIVENLQTINDNYNFQLKYIANCRTSYYSTIRDTPNHFQVSLTASSFNPDKSEALWLEQYQESVVRHILEQGRIKIEKKHLEICKDKPILAVFLLYLHQKSHGAEFENLLQENDFGRWIQKRAEMSFGNVLDFKMKLAKLVAMLPFSEDVCNQLDDFNSRLLGILANDGWVEKFKRTKWRSIHDVFADQIILSYIQDESYLVEKFIRDIFNFAYSLSSLESAFISIQRLAPYLAVNFNSLLNDEIEKELTQWKDIRNNLLETSLLSETQKLDLLSKEKLWDDAVKDTTFQTGLGTILRRIVENSEPLTEAQRANVKYWLQQTIPNISFNTFVLTWALKFSPEDLKDSVLEWIRLNSSTFQTRNLFKTWLELKLPISNVEDYTRLWLIRHQTYLKAGYVYKSWLDAGGDLNLVKKHIRLWLTKHQTHRDAQFVYKSWLDAGGDLNLVRESIRLWLAEHQTTLQAEFVFSSWLDAKGDVDFVQESIQLWLAEHQMMLETGFLFSAWLDGGGDVEFVQESIRLWLDKHQTHHDAQFVYKSWLDAKGNVDFIREPFRLWLTKHQTHPDAQFVYKSWLDAKGNIEFIRESIRLWLNEHQTSPQTRYVFSAWLDAKGSIEFVKDSLQLWLDKHKTKLQAGFVYKSWLDANGDIDLVQESIQLWLAEHQITLEAGFLFSAWLDAKGDIEFVKESIRLWLAEHQTILQAEFVYKSWLDAKGDIGLVQESIQLWLAEHQMTLQAGFLFSAWLDGGGDVEFVQESIRLWLDKHQTTLQAQFVFSSWLDAKGDVDFIREPFRLWLTKHQAHLDAQFVYKSWLDAKGDVEFVRESIRLWLAEHQTKLQAQFIFSAWLHAKGDVELVKEPLQFWLAKYQSDFGAQYVYQAWLDMELDFDYIKSFSVNWLAEHHDKQYAVFLTRRFAKQESLPLEAIRYILLWSIKFNSHKDAIWRLSQLRDKVLDINVSGEFLIASEKSINALLLKSSIDEKTKEQIMPIFSRLFCHTGLQTSDLIERIGNIYVKWIKYADSFSENPASFDDAQTPVCLERFALLLEKNLLDIGDDHFFIERFLRHLNGWSSENKQKLQPIIQDLKNKYPSDVWEIVMYC